MTVWQHFQKRSFDLVVSFIGLFFLFPVIVIAAAFSARDTKTSGFFIQTRIGQHGRPFKIIKLSTMRPNYGSTITVAGDSRITPVGAWLRRWKLDELPQLWNVLRGDMSFVGPRPDVPGFLDKLEGEDRLIQQLRPGITGPATLKYNDEEYLLQGVEDPEAHNKEVIWPDKVRLNLEYMRDWSFSGDISYILKTLIH